MSVVWLNGVVVAAARIDPRDRGFTLADGTFTTFRYRAGEMLWRGEHLARLQSAAAVLSLDPPFGEEELADGVAALARAIGARDAVGRITLTRGPTDQRGLDVPREPDPTVLITLAPSLPPPPPADVVIARSTRRNEHSALSRIKALGYGDNLLARLEARAAGAADALMANTAGAITCGTVANLLYEIDDGWFTPPLVDGPLPGLARARLIVAGAVRERSLPEPDIAHVRAAYLCNALGLTRLASICGRALPWTGPALDTTSLEGAA